jgi:hypothetical protein
MTVDVCDGSGSAYSEQLSPAIWWLRDGLQKPHERLNAWVDHLQRLQSYRRRANLLHGTLYGALPTVGMAVNEYARTTPSARANVALNIVKNMVDSTVSAIPAKARPNLSFLTSGADFAKEHEAEQLERGTRGIFAQQKFDRKSKLCFRDALIFGTGFSFWYPDATPAAPEVCVSRMHSWCVIVDDAEAVYADGPRSMFARIYRDKAELAHLYPEYRDLIRASKIDPGDEDYGFGYDATANRAEVTYAWHRPSLPGAKDGRFTMALRNVTLEDEPWDGLRCTLRGGPAFPIVPIRWSDPMVGYYGVGLAEDLAGIQAEINKLLRRIQQGHHLITGHYLVENNSDVVISHINNDLSTIVRWSGIKPEYQIPSIIAPEVYEHLWALYAKGYEISGRSQMSAQAQKPQGIDSGEAIMRYSEIQTERDLDAAQRYEDFVWDNGMLAVEYAHDLSREEGIVYKVRVAESETYDEIDWSKLDSPDGYELEAQPTSQLPASITGRIQTASDLNKLGTYDPEDLMEVMDMPDTAQITARKLASRRATERIIGRMIRDGVFVEPEPFLNLPEARKIAVDSYWVYQNKSKPPPEKRMRLLRDWIKRVEILIRRSESNQAGNTPNAPPQPPGPAQGAMPGAPPGAASPQPAPPQAA